MSKDLLFFIKKLLWFIPVAFIIALPIILLFEAGELESINSVVQLQSEAKEEILWGLGYRDPQKLYKFLSAKNHAPEILALGNSRVMQFRKDFFKEGIAFYNAGGGVKIVNQYELFVKQLHQNPKCIIMGVDKFFFNPDWSNLTDTLLYDNIFVDDPVSEVIRNNWQKIYYDYLDGKFNLRGVFIGSHRTKIGFNALFKNCGYRNDGSWYYGDIIANPKSNYDFGFKTTLSYVEQGLGHYVHGNIIYKKGLLGLKSFLQYCKDQNIYVIGFNPPYAPIVYGRMTELGDKYDYVKTLEQLLPKVFNEYGFPLFDYSEISNLGSSNKEFIDGHHGSEKAYLRLFIDMSERDSILQKFVDVEHLETKLANATSSIVVFDN